MLLNYTITGGAEGCELSFGSEDAGQDPANFIDSRKWKAEAASQININDGSNSQGEVKPSHEVQAQLFRAKGIIQIGGFTSAIIKVEASRKIRVRRTLALRDLQISD